MTNCVFICYVCILIPQKNYCMLNILVVWNITLCQPVNNYQCLVGDSVFIFRVK